MSGTATPPVRPRLACAERWRGTAAVARLRADVRFNFDARPMLDANNALIPALAATVFLAACGDAESTDDRQWYTKAPIEDPGLTITPEVPSEMAELGDPDLMGTGAEAVEEGGNGPADGAEPAPVDAGEVGPPADSTAGAGTN